MGSSLSTKRKSRGMRNQRQRRRDAQTSTASTSSSIGQSSTTSSITNDEPFQYIGGRRYNIEANSVYCLPADDEEIDREQLQHYAMKSLWEGIYGAPVDDVLKTNGSQVLDVGCGCGIWTLEMAKTFPNSEFVAVDISDVFETTAKPQNTQFIRMNALDGLPFPDESFDYIFHQMMVLSYTREQWERVVIPELFRLTKKGGWIEFSDTDMAWYDSGPKFERWIDTMLNYMESNGADGRFILRLPDILQQTGKVAQMHIDRRDMPIGSWGGRSGKWAVQSLYYVVMGAKPQFLDSMNLTSQEFDEYALDLCAEAEHYRAYAPCYRILIQKA